MPPEGMINRVRSLFFCFAALLPPTLWFSVVTCDLQFMYSMHNWSETPGVTKRSQSTKLVECLFRALSNLHTKQAQSNVVISLLRTPVQIGEDPQCCYCDHVMSTSVSSANLRNACSTYFSLKFSDLIFWNKIPEFGLTLDFRSAQKLGSSPVVKIIERPNNQTWSEGSPWMDTGFSQPCCLNLAQG